MGKAPAFPFLCPNDANLWFPLITDSRLSGAVCCKPACSSNPALSGRSGNGILFLRRAHAEPPLYHADAVQTVRRNQRRRVVLTSAFFPFSIEILNTGSAAVPPPIRNRGRAYPLGFLQRQPQQPLRTEGARQRRREHPCGDGQHRR